MGSPSLDELVDRVSALTLSLLKTPQEEGESAKLFQKAPAPKVAVYASTKSAPASPILLDLDDQSLLRLLQNHQLNNQQ